MSALEAFGLAGRVAVITGGASGIGRAAAILFAEAGAKVVVCDIDEAGLSETAAAIGPAAAVRVTDVSRRDQVDALAQFAMERHGRIDVWANVAGCLTHCAVIDANEADDAVEIGVNLKGVYWGCAAAGRIMKAQGGGAIINISSNGADSSPPGMSIYAMTKAGVNALTRSVARELGPFGVRANAVAPGFVETPLASWSYRGPDGQVDEQKREEALRLRRAVSPLGVTGEPIDIAQAMLYLASDASRFVTGQIVRANGGVSMP